ncbi:hypothetical protein [Longimicrobium sp.]|uniref:hypothetical protein n=1 Tax=Longimicrobium sp. TaxID=2029185 RepID=UPI002C9D8E1C|nr:hypothetical protein [Longimicrobium sp.]HSU15383.1 hypothetical protein [Longimicrobium sp.]
MASTHKRSALAKGGARRPPVRRKNLNIDQEKLDRVVKILGSKSETEAIDKALDIVLYRDELVEGIERIIGTGGVENYFDDHPDW